MNPTQECPECARWWSDYETATMEEFRKHSHLQIARYSHDWDSIAELEAEAAEVTARRDRMRAELLVHQKSHRLENLPAMAA